MNGEYVMGETSGVIYSILLLVLVGSALISRRIPMGQMLKMFLIWIGIFLIAFILFSFRAEFNMVWERLKSEVSGTSYQSVSGEKIILKLDDSGHFRMRAMINGVPIDFLVDSGATSIVMSDGDADKAGIAYNFSDIPVIVSTANGQSRSWRAEIEILKTETAQYENVPILVSPTLGGTNLLGMSYLNRLQSWSVSEGEMILQP